MLEELARADVATRPCLEAAVWAMPERQLVDSLEAVHRLEQRLAAMKLALVRELDGRGTAVAQGATSTAVWLRERLRLSVPAARRLVDLAAAVDGESVALRRALGDGRIDGEQARIIAETTATVRAEADPDAADRAIDLLVQWAEQFDPQALRRLGTRILDHVAPDVAEAAAERALRADEARASRDRHLTLSTKPDGRLRLTGVLDTEAAALLHAVIDPLTKPSGLDDTRTAGQRRHDALADVCRLALRTGDLPQRGGDPAQLVVTTTFDTLNARLSAGALDTGLTLSPETVRRLACDAGVLPAVLDGAGQVLDLGRQRRLITGPLRRALVLRDRGCAFPGCDRPPRWCEGHHLRHWSEGGDTSLTNAVLLCGHHHRQVHHHDWHVRLAADGLPEFLPPAWLDPDQRPRRNHCHRRADERTTSATAATATAIATVATATSTAGTPTATATAATPTVATATATPTVATPTVAATAAAAGAATTATQRLDAGQRPTTATATARATGTATAAATVPRTTATARSLTRPQNRAPANSRPP